MRIRDSHATINGDKTVTTLPSNSLQIIDDSGQTLFEIRVESDSAIRVSVYDQLTIKPIAANCIRINKEPIR